MLSWTRGRSIARGTSDVSDNFNKRSLSQIPTYNGSSLPPEVLSAVFSCMLLKDIITFRAVSTHWKELVDTEARLRFLRLTGDERCPFVLQAGPPALFDVCEFLGLDFVNYTFPQNCVERTYPGLLATLCVSHQDHNPYHSTSMAEDDGALIENVILSITRVERRMPQSTSMARQMAFRSLTNWEVARESDRIWREWWDNAPFSFYSSSSSQESLDAAAADSGFAESSLLSHFNNNQQDTHESTSNCRNRPEECLKSLNIGKMIHRATMDVSIAPAEEDGIQHQYRWKNVELDVYRTLLAFEERVSRSGLRAMVSADKMYVL